MLFNFSTKQFIFQANQSYQNRLSLYRTYTDRQNQNGGYKYLLSDLLYWYQQDADESGTDEQVYQYYTIVNETEDIIKNHELNFNTDDENTKDDPKQVLYFTFGDEEEESLNTTLLKPDPDDDSDDAVMHSNVTLITLDDGRMFMTTTPEDETYEAIEPHLLSSQDQDNVVEDESLQNTEDLNTMDSLSTTDGSETMLYYSTTKTIDEAEDVEEDENPPPKLEGRRYKCFYENCNKSYQTSYHLTIHMRTHTDSKPYACLIEGCDKAFSTGYSLKAHMRTHTGEKPYGCDVCQKHFKTSGDLLKHQRTHTGERPFMCPIEGCGRSFTTSNIRKVHIRSHTGERPYVCSYKDCGKAFSSATNYKNHVRIHSGEKPFLCSIPECGKRFTEYSSLYKHNLVHQDNNRPFPCSYCSAKFKLESSLNIHRKSKHKLILTNEGTEIIVNVL